MLVTTLPMVEAPSCAHVVVAPLSVRVEYTPVLVARK